MISSLRTESIVKLLTFRPQNGIKLIELKPHLVEESWSTSLVIIFVFVPLHSLFSYPICICVGHHWQQCFRTSSMATKLNTSSEIKCSLVSTESDAICTQHKRICKPAKRRKYWLDGRWPLVILSLHAGGMVFLTIHLWKPTQSCNLHIFFFFNENSALLILIIWIFQNSGFFLLGAAWKEQEEKLWITSRRWEI